MEQIFFYIFAIAAIVSALAVITLRNAVHSAIFVMGLGILQGRLDAPIGKYTEEALMKNPEITGRLLYTKYVFPFEVVSLLLLAALIGAIVLAMKEKK